MSVRLLPAVTEDVRPLFTLTGHTNIVHGMVLLPDGTLVSCSEDGTLRHWDIQRQRQLASLRPHGTCINGICLGHDGRYIVTAGDDSRVRWLEAGTFRELACGSAHTGYVSRVLCAPDGTVVTASGDNSVGVWPCPPGVAALDIQGFIAAAAAAKAGAAALVAPLTVQIVTSSGRIRTVKAPKPKSPKPARASSPFASGGSPGVLCSALKGHRGWVYALGLSADGLLISASLNNQILAWDLPQRRPAGALYGADQGGTHAIMGDIYIAPSNTSGRGHSDAPHVLQFLPDGRLLSCAKEVIVWDPAGWTERVLDKGNGWQIHQAAVFDQGRKVAMVSYHSLRVLDLQTGAELAAAMPHDNDVYSVVITADEQTILCGDKSGKITAWSVDQLLRGGTPARHLGSCNSLLWSSDGQRLATGASDGTTRLWAVAPALPTLLHTFRHKDPNVNAVGLLSDAEGARAGGQGDALLFSSHYGAFYAWETGTGALRFSGRPKGMTSYNPNSTWLTPDGQYVLTSAVLEGLAAWRISDGACEMIKGATAYNQNLVWDTDRRTFYTSRYNDKAFGEIQKWDLETRALIKGFGDPWAQLGRARPADKNEYANKLLIFPEIDRLVTGSSTGNIYGYDRDGTLRWELQGESSFLIFHQGPHSIFAIHYKQADSGRWIDPLDGTSQPYPHPLPPFQRAAISPDGRWLAGTCDDLQLIVVDVASGARLAEIALPDKVYQLAFSPDSRVLALGLASGMLRFVEV